MDGNLWVEELFTKHKVEILRYIKRHINNSEDAEDLCQEIFLSCHKHSDSFDPSKCDEKAWLYIITKNRLKNYYRDHKEHDDIDEISFKLADETDDVAAANNLMLLRQELTKALETLDERSKNIIILRFFEQKSFKEIADILNIREGTVRMIQFRALGKLKGVLKDVDLF